MIGALAGKLKSYAIGLLSIISTLLGLLFFVQTIRYRSLQREKEDLEEENREQKRVLDQVQDDIRLIQTLREKEKAIDEQTKKEVKKIESASDDDLLDRLNSMYNKD